MMFFFEKGVADCLRGDPSHPWFPAVLGFRILFFQESFLVSVSSLWFQNQPVLVAESSLVSESFRIRASHFQTRRHDMS